MHPLHWKLIRDLGQMWGQVLAITLVIASGMATFIMSLSTLQSLRQTQAAYYERYRFAQGFARLKRAPEPLAERIAAIPGVARVQTRVVVDVTLDVPGMAEPAVGRLISLPEGGRPPALNALYLRQGRWPEPGGRHEALVSEAFALAHQLRPGDQVRAIINGRLDRLSLVGVVLSPEYVLQMSGAGVLPDPRGFGVFWMPREELGPVYDMDGAFNDVTLTLMPGASEAEVLRRLDLLLEPYGGVEAHGREDQLSHRYLSDEIKQLRAMAMIAPSIFLGVAAFLLNVVFSRLISTQREQIAALKAFGYRHWEVGLHYLQMVLAIAAAGVVLGTLVGAWMGRGLTHLYTQFYRFPLFAYELRPGVVLLALAVGLGAAALGTLGAVVRAVRLPPAQAMRPEPPPTYRPTLVERLGWQRLVSESGRMILRHLERRPVKALLSALGIAMAAAVLVLGRFAGDALDYLMEFQFERAQRQHVSVAFVEPTSAAVLAEVAHLPGVMQVQAFRSTPVRLRHGHHSQRVAVMGLEPPLPLYRLLDPDRGELDLPPEGLMLSAKLAELLRVAPGQWVTVEVREGRRPVRSVRVAGLIDDFAGANAYMHAHALRRLLEEGPVVSGAFLRVDQARRAELYAKLKATPRVASVTVQDAMLQSFQDTVAENQRRFQSFNLFFAVVIAVGVVYNTVRITLAERGRELATLRVIGFTRAEVSAILLGEMAVLTLAAIPVGLLIGYGFAFLATLMLDTEMYRIPLVVSPRTFGLAAAVVLGAALGSGLIVRRQIDRLDLVAVLKAKE